MMKHRKAENVPSAHPCMLCAHPLTTHCIVYTEKKENLTSKVSPPLHPQHTADKPTGSAAVQLHPACISASACSCTPVSSLSHAPHHMHNAHQDTLGMLPQTLLCLFSGLHFPTVTTGLGTAWLIGYILYTQDTPPVSCIIMASILHFKEHTTYCLRLSTATGT